MIARRLILRTFVGLLLFSCATLLCDDPALAARGHLFSSTFGEPCTSAPCGPGQLDEPQGIAVNEATGDVLVLDQGDSRVEIFDAEGKFVSQFDGAETPAGTFAFGGQGLTSGIAVDNSCALHEPRLTGLACEEFDPSSGDAYVVDPEHEVIDKFKLRGSQPGEGYEYVNQVTGLGPASGIKTVGGISVDAKGELWIYQEGAEETVINVPGAQRNEFSLKESRDTQGFGFAYPGFAVDSADDLYVHINGLFEDTNLIYKFNKEGVQLRGQNNPIEIEPPTGVATELSSDDLYIDNGVSLGRFNAKGSLLERAELAGGSGSGVGVDSARQAVYVAQPAGGLVEVFLPEGPKAPTVESDTVSDITGNSATLEAEINPRGAGTQYHFEYGPCLTPSTCATSPYGASLPEPSASLNPVYETTTVSVHLQDLSAHTTYHFRVVAENGLGTATIDGRGSFTTQTVGAGFSLPDGREWEMVSPPEKRGAQIFALDQYSAEGDVIQASADGDAITYVTEAPIESAPQGYTNLAQDFSTRGTGGWGSQDIAIPHAKATGISIGRGEEYRFFSEDLSLALVQPFDKFIPSLSPEASEQTAYFRRNYDSGDVSALCSESCFQPLVTGAPGHENVPAGYKFAKESNGNCLYRENEQPRANLLCGPQFVGATPDLSHVILDSQWELTEAATTGQNLYEWSANRLTLVSVLPGEIPSSSAVLGSSSEKDAEHAISDDGSRVFWSSNKHLYMRDLARKETLQIGNEGAEFEDASTEGSRVFYSGQICEIGTNPTTSRLECVSSSANGALIGASEDSAWVYFVTSNVLAPSAIPGGLNLYVRHSGVTRFIAVLSSADASDWTGNLSTHTARVSPDGHWLAFMSQQQLTDYDNNDALSGRPDQEVYLYDAEANGGDGRLVCASCNPTGARPVGVEYADVEDHIAAGYGLLTPTTWLAASLPGWTPYQVSQALYQSRYLSDSGRLFFDSTDALVPQDVDGTEDVYQYEPPGVDDCTTASATFSDRSEGCVGLISAGNSSEESGFMDASASGGDVFFLTTSKLAGQDSDSAVDIYDAHECTGGSPCFATPPVPPPPCDTGDSCKTAPSPQPSIFGSPSSATFAGAGNVVPGTAKPTVRPRSLTRAQKLARALKACQKKKRGRPRSACTRQAHARFGAKQSSKSNASKKGGR